MLRRPQKAVGWLLGLSAVVLAGFGTLAFGRRVTSGAPTLGVTWVDTRSGVVALVIEPGSPAEEAGLSPGDRLVTIDGIPVRSALDAGEAPWRVEPGVPIRLESVRPGAPSRTVAVAAVRRPDIPTVYGYLALVGAAFLVSGTFVAWRWPRLRGATVYAILGQALFAHLVFSHTGAADLLDWIVHAVDVAAGALVPALLFHLSIQMARRSVAIGTPAVAAAYLPAPLLMGATLWIEGFGGAFRFSDPARAVSNLERFELLFLSVAVVGSVALFARSYLRSPSGTHRTQVRWMLWGLVVGLSPFAFVYALPWALGASVPEWTELTVLPMLFVPAAFTTAMARYRLHDLDLVLRRGFAFVVLAFATVGLYAAVLLVLGRIARDLHLRPSVLGFLAALVTASVFSRLRAWVRAGVDRAFYRARYSYRATLLEWSRELNAEMDLPSLLDLLEGRVRATLGVGTARVLVASGGRRFVSGSSGEAVLVELDRSVADGLERQASLTVEPGALAALPEVRFLFGMKVRGRLTAVLVTSGREGADEPFSSEDRALLATLCSHAATAIEAARLVREVRLHAEQVETLKARQETILESSGVGLLLVDAQDRILAWNRRLEEIYGLPREEAIGRRLAEVFPLHTVRRMARTEESAGPDGEARLYGHVLINRQGRRLVVHMAISPVGGGGAGARGDGDGARVVTVDDITERVKLEEQVLRQERLASLGMLAAGVAHEVNTPLTGISSYTQMLLEEMPDDDPRRDILRKIEEQSLRASKIANSLLNLSRPEDAAFEALDLNEAVREVMRLFEPQIRGRGIRLEADLAPDLPPVPGHRGKIQQVLLNLLLNARDAVAGDGRIAVATSSRGDRVTLEVLDDGAGIAEEDLPRVFDPFFTTKGRGKGTGLGLSISYGIVREHDGEILVDSVPGERTRFRVELPVRGRASASA